MARALAARADDVAVDARLDERSRRLVVPWNGAPGRHEVTVELDG